MRLAFQDCAWDRLLPAAVPHNRGNFILAISGAALLTERTRSRFDFDRFATDFASASRSPFLLGSP